MSCSASASFLRRVRRRISPFSSSSQERHMAEITLNVESGRPLGTRPSGRLRTAGKIPGVVYGHGMAPIPVAIGARDLRAALTTDAGLNALLSLKIGDTTHLAIAKTLQRHPVRQTVTHVDFQVVRRDEIVTAEVRIVLVGEAEAVHRADGTVDHEMLTLQIKARPGDVPASIEIDVSSLEIGDSLRVSDLTLPEGVTTEADPEAPVVIAHAARALEPEPEAEVVEGAEPAAGGEQAPAADEG
jgi:large subunit ribosomal protein L25